MEQIKQYTINLLTELITEYVNREGALDFYTGYVNSQGRYVELQSKDNLCIDYAIQESMIPIELMYDEIEGGEIIFQFNDDMYGRDIDEVQYFREDYEDLLKDKDKYIKDKVEYIISLTW